MCIMHFSLEHDEFLIQLINQGLINVHICEVGLTSTFQAAKKLVGGIHMVLNLKIYKVGVSGWLSWLSIQLRFRSQSHSSWIQGPHRALC